MAITMDTPQTSAARPAGRWLLTVVVFLVMLVLVWAFSLFLHEVGHGLTVAALGGKVLWLRVWPGVEAWPSPGRPAEGTWGTLIAALGYTTGPGWGADSWQDAVVGLMGSGFNLLLAGLALGSLWLFRPRGWLRLLLVAEALMFADLLLYCTLPEFLSLPHYVLYGGRVAEPLNAAELLGCPRWAFLLGVGLVSALMMWGLVGYVRRGRRT